VQNRETWIRPLISRAPSIHPEPSLFERVALGLVWFAWAAMAGAALCWLAGCSSPTRIAGAGINASAGLAENLSTAHGEIVATQPHADATGQAHLQSADAAVTAAKTKLPAINAGLAQVAPLQAKVNTLEKQFWSPRQRGLFLVVSIAVGSLLAVTTVLYFATPLSPPIGAAAAGLFHLVTLGIPKLFHAIVSRIQRKVLTAKAGTPAAPLLIQK